MSKSKTVTKAAPSAGSNAELDAPLTLTPKQIEAVAAGTLASAPTFGGGGTTRGYVAYMA
jgi:hypothetical protein